ncbi:MAG: branched-chain amino acid ABC transporter substrate-binding protein [Thiomonas sp.]|uniref:Putative ABC-type branched-chain amino acid transport systems, periplasmic component n=1 Tax=mine drainage metagenome TaxID=410659 RepID=E6PPB8_9ZZZZ
MTFASRSSIVLAVWACLLGWAQGAPAPVAASSQPVGQSQAPPVTVVIGSAAPLTGPQAAYGEDNTDGVRLAIDALNRQHISIASRPVVWVLDAQDDRGDPKRAAEVARKFVAAHVNGVVGHLDSSCTAAASPIYFKAGIPEITPSSSDPKLAQQGFDTFYRIIANDYAIGAGLALYAEKGLQAKTVVVVDDRSTYGISVSHAFSRVARLVGLQIEAHETIQANVMDFSSLLDKIKTMNPDVVFFGGMAAQAGPMLQQMRGMGIKARLLGGDGICTPELARLAGAAANSDVICADGGVPLSRMPGGEAWQRRFTAQFGANAFQLYSPYAYDATMVLAHAMMKAGSTHPAVYRHDIRHLDYDGVTKTDIRFNRDGELVDPAITISSFPEGRKTALSK